MPAEYYWPSPHNTQICRNHHSQICGSSLAAIHSHLLCSRNSPDSSLSQMLRCRWWPCSSLDRPIAAGCRLAKLWVSIGASVPSLRSYGTEAALQAVAWFNYGTVAVRLVVAGFYYGTVAVRLAVAGLKYGPWARWGMVVLKNYRCSAKPAKYAVCQLSDTVRFKRLYSVNSI